MNYMYNRLSERGKVAVLGIQKLLDGLDLAEIDRVIEVVRNQLETHAVYRAPAFENEAPVTVTECRKMIDVAVKEHCSAEKITEAVIKAADKIAGELAADLAKATAPYEKATI